jgi:hypothetical protein
MFPLVRRVKKNNEGGSHQEKRNWECLEWSITEKNDYEGNYFLL